MKKILIERFAQSTPGYWTVKTTMDGEVSMEFSRVNIRGVGAMRDYTADVYRTLNKWYSQAHIIID